MDPQSSSPSDNRRFDDPKTEEISERNARYFMQSGVAMFIFGVLAAISHGLHLNSLRWVFALASATALVMVFVFIFKIDRAIREETKAQEKEGGQTPSEA